jgi:hypothetical protein
MFDYSEKKYFWLSGKAKAPSNKAPGLPLLPPLPL